VNQTNLSIITVKVRIGIDFSPQTSITEQKLLDRLIGRELGNKPIRDTTETRTESSRQYVVGQILGHRGRVRQILGHSGRVRQILGNQTNLSIITVKVRIGIDFSPQTSITKQKLLNYL
jgi:hypothetical protein